MAVFDDAVVTKRREEVDTKTRHPEQFHVVMLNDSYTPMEYVVYILHEIFDLSIEQSTMTMFQIHTQNKGIVGTYTRSEAYAKIDEVEAQNLEYGFELRVTAEKA